MTYAALVALAILRDPFTALDREGILRYLKLSQREDGRCAHLLIYSLIS
jgi:geranylgeranyl transferase type-1 subunit beta